MSNTVIIVSLGALLLACTTRSAEPTNPLTVPVFSRSANGAAHARSSHFGTPLASREEVMPPGVVNTSSAVGNAMFDLSPDGTELRYRLIVANIENVFQAHIHSAPSGVNGGIVVWLYPSTAVGPVPTGGGRIDGVIAEGTITAADLVNALAGQPLSSLITLLSTGGAYVNVHTNDGVAPTNTGPGDFPGGEIRGQVEDRGH